MMKALATLLVVVWTGQASAENCPPFFRFVDFGLEVSTGNFSRGGPLMRAESLEGTPLLLRDQTTCRAVRDIASDGHGNPIPVVTRVYYNPEKTGLDLTELSVSFTKDSKTTTDQNALAHQARLKDVNVETTRGPNFLCAHAQDDPSVSCQIISPYPGNLALVVYCDEATCEMPAMAMQDRMQISASWAVSAAQAQNPDGAGNMIAAKIESMHAFFEPLM